MSTDTIADMLTRLRNAGMALHDSVSMPSSKMKFELAKLLEREGYIESVKKQEVKPQDVLVIKLRRVDGQLAFKKITRMSTPSRRLYVGAKEIPHVSSGLGTAVVSTSKGLMTDREAREARVGGELVCTIW